MSLAPLDLQERSVANICIYRWSLHWSFFATSASFFEELGFENLHLKNGMAEGLYDHTKDKSFLFLLQLLVFLFRQFVSLDHVRMHAIFSKLESRLSSHVHLLPFLLFPCAGALP